MSAPEGAPRRGRALADSPATGDATLDALARLVAVVTRLRAPDGCPWDREQTLLSMAPHLVEEAFEAREAIEEHDDEAAREELGDMLLVLFLSTRIAADEGRFDLATIAEGATDKLVRRHPHVFGDVEVDGARQALANWERIKRAERREKQTDASAVAGVPRSISALHRAQRLGKKAVGAGFRWRDAGGALAKLEEEVRELRREVEAEERDPERIESELGDVLIAAAFLGNYLEIDPERACRAALRRFEARFRVLEAELEGGLDGAPLEELVRAWRRAKEAVAARDSRGG